MLSFLLRFQEQCEDLPEGAVETGTATKTRVMHEQPDTDPTRMGHRSFPGIQANAGTIGTITNTQIRNEQGDADNQSVVRPLLAQVIMGTTTKTAVKMEMDDQDPQQHELTVIPKCFSS